jgi:hypothetical protein
MFVYVCGKKLFKTRTSALKGEGSEPRLRGGITCVISQPLQLGGLGCDVFSCFGIGVGWCVGEFEKVDGIGRTGVGAKNM